MQRLEVATLFVASIIIALGVLATSGCSAPPGDRVLPLPARVHAATTAIQEPGDDDDDNQRTIVAIGARWFCAEHSSATPTATRWRERQTLLDAPKTSPPTH